MMISKVSKALCVYRFRNHDNRYSNWGCEIRQIPTDIPAEALFVDLSNNMIDDIEIGVFSHLQKCRLLELYSNNLTHLKPGMFSGLLALGELNLDHNPISVIETGTFSDLNNCRHLTLSNNALVHLVPGMFKSLVELEVLDISHNQIRVIEPGTFSDLGHCINLRLEYNALTHLRARVFKGLIALELLELHGNSIMNLQPGIFSGLNSLEELNLHQNKISFIGCKTFANLTNLKYLHLSHNFLSTLERNVFGSTLPHALIVILSLNPLEYDARMCWLTKLVSAYRKHWSKVTTQCNMTASDDELNYTNNCKSTEESGQFSFIHFSIHFYNYLFFHLPSFLSQGNKQKNVLDALNSLNGLGCFLF